MTKSAILLAAAWVFVAMLVIVRPIDDVDVFWQIKLGQIMLERHALVTTDLFTFTHEGEAVPPFSWLCQIVLAALYQVGSWPLLRFANAVCVASAYLVAGLTLERSERRIGVLIGMALGISAGLAHTDVRPQSAGLLCFAIFLFTIRSQLRTRIKLPLVLAIVAVWQNLHPSALVALAPLGALVVASLGRLREASNLFLMMLMVLVGSWATPLGWHDAEWSQRNIEISRNLLGVTEWLPPWDEQMRGVMQPFWLGLGIAVVSLARVRLRVRLDDLFLFLAMTVLCFTASRFAMFWSIAMVPIWGRWIDQSLPETWRLDLSHPVSTRVFAATITGVVALAAAAGWAIPVQFREIPMTGVAKLHDILPEGRIYNYREWGGPLILAGYPEWKVAIDGRLYLFPASEWVDYVMTASGMLHLRRIEEKFHPDAFFLRPTHDAELIKQLRGMSTWREVYADDLSIIFVRSRP